MKSKQIKRLHEIGFIEKTAYKSLNNGKFTLRVRSFFDLLVIFFILGITNKGIAQNKKIPAKQIPTVAWWSIPSEQTTLA